MKMQMIVSLFAQRNNQRHLGSEVVEVNDDMPYEEFGEVVLEGANRAVARINKIREKNAERRAAAVKRNAPRVERKETARPASLATLTDFDVVLRFEPTEGEVHATVEQNAEGEGYAVNETPASARKRNIGQGKRGCTHPSYVVREVDGRQQPCCVYCREVLEL